jgi:signal peptidase I
VKRSAQGGDYPYKWWPDGTPVEDGPRPNPTPRPSRETRPDPDAAAAELRTLVAELGDDHLPDDTPGPVKKARWLSGLEWVLLILGALTIALLIKTFLFQAFYIPSESMDPTLKKNDRVIVNKLSYKLHDVHRGDIVVFKTPEGVAPDVKDLVKRVIGLPGETVEGRSDGIVYVNGKPLKEPYTKLGRSDPPFAPVKIPKDAYWVMGDNRQDSKDSRLFPKHFVPEKDIVGRVFVRVWPLNRLDIL